MRPIALLILDGWGFSRQTLGNAILSANTPRMDFIHGHYPGVLLQASGPSVGLLWREPGNSEVGHLTIGAGRVIFQYATRISKDIESGAFFENPALSAAVNHALTADSSLHLIGLLGSGSVHSLFEHLSALSFLAKNKGLRSVKLHLIADGKDSGLKESVALITKLKQKIISDGVGEIVSVVGRMYAMNRTGNWDLTRKAYDLWTGGAGEVVPDIIQAIVDKYDSGLTDTDLPPVISDPSAVIRDNDSVIFFNFREDSMRQPAQAFFDPNFTVFPVKSFENVRLTAMTRYLTDIPPENTAFLPVVINNGLAEIFSVSGKKQLHIAETEKYAHATYFFNGLRNEPYPGEDRILIESLPSPVSRPEMRALDIAAAFKKALSEGVYDFFMLNIANADILAHSGNLNAAIAGVEVADAAVGEIVSAVLEAGGIAVITADHGNAESMVYTGSGDIETRHNPNPVPLYAVAKEFERERDVSWMDASRHKAHGILSDVAPTILELAGIQKPPEMAGESLIPLLQ